MRQYISKITYISLFVFVVCVCIAGGVGYMHSRTTTIPSQRNFTELETSFNTLHDRFDSGGYSNVINIVSKMGDKKALAETITKYDVRFPSESWQENFNILFGKNKLEMFVLQRISQNQNPGADKDESGLNLDVAFPDIQLMGMTYLKSNKKISSVFTIDGHIEIWMWTRNNDKWETDSILPGYMVKSAHIGSNKISLTLCSLTDVRAQKEYTFDVSSTMADLIDPNGHHILPQEQEGQNPNNSDI